MDTVTISSKYQVVIPRAARKQLRIKPGQKMQVIVYDNRVVLIPIRPIEEAQGIFKGIDTDNLREEEEEDEER
jgi:AbrB family looped-hinge helix DNA binding protein